MAMRPADPGQTIDMTGRLPVPSRWMTSNPWIPTRRRLPWKMRCTYACRPHAAFRLVLVVSLFSENHCRRYSFQPAGLSAGRMLHSLDLSKLMMVLKPRWVISTPSAPVFRMDAVSTPGEEIRREGFLPYLAGSFIIDRRSRPGA